MKGEVRAENNKGKKRYPDEEWTVLLSFTFAPSTIHNPGSLCGVSDEKHFLFFNHY